MSVHSYYYNLAPLCSFSSLSSPPSSCPPLHSPLSTLHSSLSSFSSLSFLPLFPLLPLLFLLLLLLLPLFPPLPPSPLLSSLWLSHSQMWQAHGLDLYIIPYGCIATGHNMGMIQVVQEAETVAKVTSRHIPLGYYSCILLCKFLYTTCLPPRSS